MEIIYHLLVFFSEHPIVFDGSLVFLGVAAARLPQFAVFIRIAVFLVSVTRWYFKNHPVGRRHAEETQVDQKLDKLYQDELQEYEKNHLHGTVFTRENFKKALQYASLIGGSIITLFLASKAYEGIVELVEI